MSKRLILMFVIMTLCLVTTVFAAESNNAQVSPYEIISPKINANGDVIKEQHLLISLRLNQAMDAVVTLTLLDEPKVVVASTEAAKKLRQIASQAPSHQTFAANEAGSANLDPIATVSRKDVLADESTRDVVQAAYSDAGVSLQEAHDAYQVAYAAARKKMDAERLDKLIYQRKLIQSNLKSLHYARQEYVKSAEIYTQIRNKYELLYRVKVVDKTPITLQGALPIFNLTVKDIQTGKYELVVEDQDTGKRIGERVVFVIKHQEKAAEEMIERVKDQMIDIWKTN